LKFAASILPALPVDVKMTLFLKARSGEVQIISDTTNQPLSESELQRLIMPFEGGFSSAKSRRIIA
jgi:hypothetical protein